MRRIVVLVLACPTLP